MQDKASFEELKAKKAEVTDLRNSLNELDAHKEKYFNEKEEIQKRISELISKVKLLKGERNGFTQFVQEEKKKRKELNQEITKKITEIKGIVKVTPKGDSPEKLKDEIRKMEYAIETQGLSFEKEQKMMKQIKDKKKKLTELEKAYGDFIKARTMSKEIDGLKKNANKLHSEITQKADESQKKHEEMIAISKEIDELKKKEEECMSKFIEYKKQFTDVNSKLKIKLEELSKTNEKITGHKVENQRAAKRRVEQVLKDKEEAVEEKIKKGKKLTTEDLLVFQRDNIE